MSASPNAAVYATGYKSVVTIASSSYSQAKYFNLPEATAGVVNIQHLGGFVKQPDGRTDFGKVVISIPQDGSGLLVDTTVTVVVAPTQGALTGKTYTNTSAYCTKDTGGNLVRGASVDRILEFELLQDGTWT